eukprot:200308-Amphidinium_carterae.1
MQAQELSQNHVNQGQELAELRLELSQSRNQFQSELNAQMSVILRACLILCAMHAQHMYVASQQLRSASRRRGEKKSTCARKLASHCHGRSRAVLQV